MDKEKIKIILAELKKNYRTFEISDTSTAWWGEALADYEEIEVFKAIKNWVFTQKWPPTIADIVQSLEELKVPEWAKQDALEAWNHRGTNPIAKAVFSDLECTYGPYGTWLVEDNQWRYKEFAERYQDRMDAKRHEVKNKLLLGTGSTREILPAPTQNLIAMAMPKVTQ